MSVSRQSLMGMPCGRAERLASPVTGLSILHGLPATFDSVVGVNITPHRSIAAMPNYIPKSAVKGFLREINGTALYAVHRIDNVINNISVASDTLWFLSMELDRAIRNANMLVTEMERELDKINAPSIAHKIRPRRNKR